MSMFVRQNGEDHNSNGWVWDGQSAQEVSLKEMMYEARRDGSLGVVILSYVNDRWKVIFKYPANKPLPEALL